MVRGVAPLTPRAQPRARTRLYSPAAVACDEQASTSLKGAKEEVRILGVLIGVLGVP